MKGAILYEYSGIVRDAMIAAGHDCISVDYLPTERQGPHWQGNVWDFLKLYPANTFDFIIAHPPCTRLCNSGVLRLYKDGKKVNGVDPVKWADMERAANEFKQLLELDCEIIVVENPIMHGHCGQNNRDTASTNYPAIRAWLRTRASGRRCISKVVAR